MEKIIYKKSSYSPVQTRYIELVRAGRHFEVVGHSLHCQTGEIFPVAMADAIHVWPQRCHRPNYLDRSNSFIEATSKRSKDRRFATRSTKR